MSTLQLFSDNVRSHCEKNGLTQNDLALRTNINPDIITLIWEGEYDADLADVALIAKALNLQSFELLLPDGWTYRRI